MLRARRRQIGLGILLLCTLMASLGWGLGAASPAKTSGVSHWPTPAEAMADDFAGASIIMDEPAPGDSAAVDIARALMVVSEAGFPPDMQAGAPETALKVVTSSPDSGSAELGETSSGYENKLAWVVMYRGDGSASTGRMPITGPEQDLAPPEPLKDCVSIFVIDAQSAVLLDVVQLCTE